MYKNELLPVQQTRNPARGKVKEKSINKIDIKTCQKKKRQD